MLGGGYQILAAQEIPNDKSADRLLNLLPAGHPWAMCFEDTSSRMDNGFWFQSSIAANTGNAVLFASTDRDRAGRLKVDAQQAEHPPHAAHFKAGEFDFTLITIHLTFKGGRAAESRRELEVLLDYLDDYFENPDNDPDVIVCGDFNLPSRASGETAGSITVDDIIDEDGRFDDEQRRLYVLVDEPTSRSRKRLGSPVNNYDHFVISEDCREEFVAAYRLADEVLTQDPADPDRILTSDHFPIVAQFRLRGIGTTGQPIRPDKNR